MFFASAPVFGVIPPSVFGGEAEADVVRVPRLTSAGAQR